MQNGMATLENDLVASQEVKHTPAILPSHATPNNLPKRNECVYSYKDFYMNVHSSRICYSLKVETVQMFTNRWMDKQTVVYPYTGILFSNKKEWIYDICGNLDKFHNNYAKWKKLDKKEYRLYDSIYIKLNSSSTTVQESRLRGASSAKRLPSWSQGPGIESISSSLLCRESVSPSEPPPTHSLNLCLALLLK